MTTEDQVKDYLLKEKYKNQFINPMNKAYEPSWVKENLVKHLIIST